MKKTILLFAILWFMPVCRNLKAQQAQVSAGGDAAGSNGKASYTVGQLTYTTLSSTSGTVIQGIQVSYEITEVNPSKLEEKIEIGLKAYPNPVIDNLILSVENSDQYQYRATLYDVQGRILKTLLIVDSKTNIEMNDLASALYFLKVESDNKEIKTYQIIKK